MMRLRICLLAVAVVSSLAESLPAQLSYASRLPPSERQHRCPVVTSELVGLDSPFVRYRGIKIYLSSPQAVWKWNRSPAAYIDRTIVPQLTGLVRLPERPIAQEYCPVYRDRKVSHFDPFVVHEGRKVYFYDELARRRWLVDTARYLDLELLPQLRPPAGAEAEAPPAELEGLLVEPEGEAESP